jgi:hypothetical protein
MKRRTVRQSGVNKADEITYAGRFLAPLLVRRLGAVSQGTNQIIEKL